MALEGQRSRGCRYRIIAYIQREANVYGTYVERQRRAKMSNAQGHIREGVRLYAKCTCFSALQECLNHGKERQGEVF